MNDVKVVPYLFVLLDILTGCIKSIDHSHIVLIIRDLNGLGHLPEFADQISGQQILVNGTTRSDRRNQYNMRMVYSVG